MTQQEKGKVFVQVSTMAKETKEPAPDKDALFAFLDEPKLESNVPGSIKNINKTIASKIGKGMPEVPDGVAPADIEGLNGLTDRELYTKGIDAAIENNAASKAVEKMNSLAGKTAEVKTPEKVAPVKVEGGMSL